MLTDTWQTVKVYMLNKDKQWVNQDTRNVIHLHWAAEGHIPASKASWNMVHLRRKWQTTREVKGNPLQYSYLENHISSVKVQKDMTLKDEHLR